MEATLMTIGCQLEWKRTIEPKQPLAALKCILNLSIRVKTFHFITVAITAIAIGVRIPTFLEDSRG